MRGARLILVMFLAACGDEAAPRAGEPQGSFILAGDSGTLLEAPARATTCTRDTTTAIVAVGDAWAAAVSLRAPALSADARELQVTSTIEQPGRAVVAVRSLGDSLFAWISTDGLVRLRGGDSLAGTFEATIARDSLTMRVSGEFAAPVPPDHCA